MASLHTSQVGRLHGMWRRVDEVYIKPFFGGRKRGAYRVQVRVRLTSAQCKTVLVCVVYGVRVAGCASCVSCMVCVMHRVHLASCASCILSILHRLPAVYLASSACCVSCIVCLSSVLYGLPFICLVWSASSIVCICYRRHLVSSASLSSASCCICVWFGVCLAASAWALEASYLHRSSAWAPSYLHRSSAWAPCYLHHPTCTMLRPPFYLHHDCAFQHLHSCITNALIFQQDECFTT